MKESGSGSGGGAELRRQRRGMPPYWAALLEQRKKDVIQSRLTKNRTFVTGYILAMHEALGATCLQLCIAGYPRPTHVYQPLVRIHL
jgi:hypothetical protein